MSDKPETIYFALRENLIQSILMDAFTFGAVIFTFWFNQRYLGGSGWVGAFLVIFLFVLIAGFSRSKRFKSPEEAIAWLEEIKSKK